jgi:hypothetical protein
VFRDSNSRSHVTFSNCSFVLDTTAPSVLGGYCIAEGTAVPASQFGQSDRRDLTELINCSFDARAPSSLIVGRGGRVTSRGCNFAGHVAGVTIAHGSGDYYGRWESFDDSFDSCSGAAIGRLYSYQGKTEVRLNHSSWKESWKPVSLLEGSELKFGNVVWSSARALPVASAPPAAGVAGDRARLLVPVSGKPSEWVCTSTGDAAATWAPLLFFSETQTP